MTSMPSPRCLASFSTGNSGFFRCKFVSGAFYVSCLSALAAGQARFFGTEPMRGAFPMSGTPAFTCNLPLLIAVHACESSSLFFRHGLVLSRAGPRTN
jgi:hypothetical protein